MGRSSTFYKPIPLPTRSSREDFLTFMVGNFEQASLHQDRALTNLTETERLFLFLHARSITEHFTPQISNRSDQTIVRLKANLRFAELREEQVSHASLIAAAQVLARLANERRLYHVAEAWTNPLPPAAVPPGVTGDVLLLQETSYGLILIGGPGPNTNELDKGIGLIIDVGGNDLYRGMIAASTDEDQGNAVVIDLNGGDTYHGGSTGTGHRAAVGGIVIDHAGDDVYQLGMGSGGTGFGGLGILFDAKGNDVYIGARLTQGAAIGGPASSSTSRELIAPAPPAPRTTAGWPGKQREPDDRCRERSRHPCSPIHISLRSPRDGGLFFYPQGGVFVDR